MKRGIGDRVDKITITGDPKKIDVKSSDVSHVSGPLSLPIESVDEVVAVHGGEVVQGGALRVRGGRSGALPMRIRDPLHRLTLKVDLVRSTINRGDVVQLRIWLKNDTADAVRLPREYQLVDGTLLLQIGTDKQKLSMPEVATADMPFADPLRPGDEREYLVSLTGVEGFEFKDKGRYEILILRLFGVWVPEDQRVLYVNIR
jgi:hypothetical protein